MNDKMNNEQIINTIMAFLSRTDIKGGEVGTFIEITQWLQEKFEETKTTVKETKTTAEGPPVE